jgi:hypothetical protein
MSVNVGSEIKKTGAEIATKTKEAVMSSATTSGVATNFVGFVLSIPLSFAYDFVYDLLSKKVITNQMASDALKVLLPAGIGAVFQFGKLPGGNIVAGTGYGIALLSLFKIVIERLKGVKTGTKTKAVPEALTEIKGLWGLEGQ